MAEQPSRALRPNLPAQGAPGPSDVRIASRAGTSREAIDAAAAHLRARAFLYDDPAAYTAGVRDALSEVNAGLDAGSE